MYLLETLYHSLDDDEVSASAKNTRAPLGVEVLYGAFKKWGYQTLPDATRRYQTLPDATRRSRRPLLVQYLGDWFI